MIDRDTSMRGSYTLQKMASATGESTSATSISMNSILIKSGPDGLLLCLGYYVDDTWDGAYHKIKVRWLGRGSRFMPRKDILIPNLFGNIESWKECFISLTWR